MLHARACVLVPVRPGTRLTELLLRRQSPMMRFADEARLRPVRRKEPVVPRGLLLPSVPRSLGGRPVST